MEKYVDRSHACCAWCAPPIHVYTAFVDSDIETEEELIALWGDAAWKHANMEILAARLAPEASAEAMVAEGKDRGYWSTLHEGGVVTTRARKVFGRIWLVTYKNIREAATMEKK